MSLSNEERENLIKHSIKTCQAKGIGLIHCTWGVYWNYKKKRWEPKAAACCALGCTILECQDKLPRNLDWRKWTIEKILDVKGEWVWNFQLGFDGYEKSVCDDGALAYELGNKLRKEFGFAIACSEKK